LIVAPRSVPDLVSSKVDSNDLDSPILRFSDPDSPDPIHFKRRRTLKFDILTLNFDDPDHLHEIQENSFLLREILKGLTGKQKRDLSACANVSIKLAWRTLTPSLVERFRKASRKPLVVVQFGWEDPSGEELQKQYDDKDYVDAVYTLGNYYKGLHHKEYVAEGHRHRYFPQAFNSFGITDASVDVRHLISPRLVTSSRKRYHTCFTYGTDCEITDRDHFWTALYEDENFSMEERNGMHATGKCFGAAKDSQKDATMLHEAECGPDIEYQHVYYSGEAYNTCLFSQYKFNIAMEHGANLPDSVEAHKARGWVTEKIMNSFLADSIPIFMSRLHGDVFSVFNQDAFVYADGPGGWDEARRRIRYLSTNETAYLAMLGQPALSSEGIRNLMTWHSDSWPVYGKFFQEQFVDDLAKLCKDARRHFDR